MEKDFNYPPLVFNVYKPAGISSYDVVRHFKRNLPRGYGKIGHFGTLDPFAEGVLMIAVSGATRINDYVHQYLPKTYVAKGKLGVHTDTGDLTVLPLRIDDSEYLNGTISKFSAAFIEEQIQKKFVGSYLQAPHKYSAAKFEGKPLHEWAREGVDIRKDEVERQVYSLRVVDYSFPYLTIEATVSSGTYIRSLFQDCAEFLGTLGCLETLLRSSVGAIRSIDALKEAQWPIRGDDWNPLAYGMTMDQVLPLPVLSLDDIQAKRYSNGIPLPLEELGPVTSASSLFWVKNTSDKLLGLASLTETEIRAIFNLAQ